MTELTQRGVVVPSPGQSVANGIALLALLRQLGLSVDAAIGGLGAVANLSPEALAALEAFDGEVELSDAVVAGLLESATEARDALDTRVTDPGVATPATAAALNWEVAQTSLGTVDHATVQAAATAAAGSGKRLYAAGEYTTNQTLTIECDADLSGLTINYTGSGTAVRVGSTSQYTRRVTVTTPKVIAANKTSTGWDDVEDTVGIELVNLDSCLVTIPLVRGFETNLRMRGTGRGHAYNTTILEHLDNGMVNLHLTADTSGWCNQNTIIGGRLSHNNDEGIDVTGVRSLVIDYYSTHLINNNTFTGLSLESNVADYLMVCGGRDNMFLNCRWEDQENSPEILWLSGSQRNQVFFGWGVNEIVHNYEDGAASRQMVWHTNGLRMVTPGGNPLVLENRLSADAPADVVLAAGATGAGTDPSTGYAVQRTAQNTRMKQPSDSHPRLVLNHTQGRIDFGSGSADPSLSLRAFGGQLRIDGATTQSTAPSNGSGGALPANAAVYLRVYVGSTAYWLPLFPG